ncbi:MAG: hypothetical protein WKG01_13825 [Kofleriaceae bacterium]
MTRSLGLPRRITQPMAVVSSARPRIRHEAVRDLGFRCFRMITGHPIEVAHTRNTMMAFARRI